MALQLGQIKIRAGALLEQGFYVMKEIQSKVEQGCRYRLPIDGSVLFDQVPSARADEQHSRLCTQEILLAFRTYISNLAAFISMPVTWDELEVALKKKKTDGLYFDPKAALARLEKRGDLFAPVQNLKQSLPADLAHVIE